MTTPLAPLRARAVPKYRKETLSEIAGKYRLMLGITGF
jgi:hypothetical protein